MRNLLLVPAAAGDNSGVADYDLFARFYDQASGDRTPAIERVRGYIERYRPSAGTLLELGCGTGALLAGLAGGMRLTGIDLSPEMLKIAARNVPGARFVEGDITAFSLGERFDAVICVFDTINHLPRFDLWVELFDRVHEHLATGGLFVFDVNTTGRLRTLCRGPAVTADLGENVLIMDVKPGAHDDEATWEIRVFERDEGGLFRLHRERITELGVPLARIREAIGKHFDVLEESSPRGGPVTDDSPRVFFAFRNRLPGEIGRTFHPIGDVGMSGLLTLVRDAGLGSHSLRMKTHGLGELSVCVMPRFRSHPQQATNDQNADSGTVPGQRGTPEGTAPAQSAEYSQGQGPGATQTGYPAQQSGTQQGYPAQQQAGYRQTEGRRGETRAYDESAEGDRASRHRPYYGMAGTLMVLSGLLTFFMGITGLIRATFFNSVANYPFYFSVRSRGVLFIVLGAVAFVVGVGLLLHMYWARHIATVVAVVLAVANFMFLPFYPFWSILLLALNILIIWELTRDRRREREFARYPA